MRIARGVHSPIRSAVHSPMGRGGGLRVPTGYDWLYFNGQKVIFNNQPVLVKKVTS